VALLVGVVWVVSVVLCALGHGDVASVFRLVVWWCGVAPAFGLLLSGSLSLLLSLFRCSTRASFSLALASAVGSSPLVLLASAFASFGRLQPAVGSALWPSATSSRFLPWKLHFPGSGCHPSGRYLELVFLPFRRHARPCACRQWEGKAVGLQLGVRHLSNRSSLVRFPQEAVFSW